jgi:glycosyltransferase involved in cell wall biosynthesis
LTSSTPPSLCVLPRLEGLGGPASFRARLSAGLAQRGIRAHSDPADPTTRAVLVIGGTRRLGNLLLARRRGLPVIQRLDGMNWLHRRRRTGLRHYLRSEVNNLLLAFIRRRLADRIVYQSGFTRDWWQRVHGMVRAPGTVIYNGVDLTEYSPDGPHERPSGSWRIQVVEGHIDRGMALGLENAVGLARLLADQGGRPAELWVAGDVHPALVEKTDASAPGLVRWLGVVNREEIPALDRSAHLLYSAEINPPCPNSVVEALACGLPVAGFAAGALPELVEGDAGRMVPWGGSVWKLDPPDLEGLAAAALPLLYEQERFRAAARARAEAAFGLDRMVEKYLEILF